jgi:hypothetical protein
MSALSNGSLKKSEKRDGPSIDDIGSSKGIAIGRGYEDHVAAKTIAQEYAPPVAMSLPEAVPSEEQLDQFIENSALPTESKEATRATLHDKLIVELQKGEQANALAVKEQVTDITANLPDIRIYLRSFIANYAGIPKTIRILTQKLLD